MRITQVEAYNTVPVLSSSRESEMSIITEILNSPTVVYIWQGMDIDQLTLIGLKPVIIDDEILVYSSEKYTLESINDSYTGVKFAYSEEDNHFFIDDITDETLAEKSEYTRNLIIYDDVIEHGMKSSYIGDGMYLNNQTGEIVDEPIGF